jgi:predicted dinucleotide-binding enzyme
METRTIAILGAGDVGTTLGAGFAKLGHNVVLGSREPDSETVHGWVDSHGENVCSANYADAVGAADMAVLCVPGFAAERTIGSLPPGVLDGKIVVDVTNHLGKGLHDQLSLPMGLEESAAQRIQKADPTLRVVKAFNTTGVQSMIDPQVECGPPNMPICGNDPDAKLEVAELVRECGWEPVDLGGIEEVPVLEAMTVGWVLYGRATGQWDHCFKFARPR